MKATKSKKFVIILFAILTVACSKVGNSQIISSVFLANSDCSLPTELVGRPELQHPNPRCMDPDVTLRVVKLLWQEATTVRTRYFNDDSARSSIEKFAKSINVSFSNPSIINEDSIVVSYGVK